MYEIFVVHGFEGRFGRDNLPINLFSCIIVNYKA